VGGAGLGEGGSHGQPVTAASRTTWQKPVPFLLREISVTVVLALNRNTQNKGLKKMTALKAVTQQVFRTPDGSIFESKADADAHLARPLILEALKLITAGKSGLAEWLLEVKEQFVDIYDTGVVRRVTKAEHKALSKDFENLATLAEEFKAANRPFPMPFLLEHAESVKSSFRWPTVTRLKPEERDVAIRNSLLALCKADETLADWLQINREAIIQAYSAGKPKRPVSEKATAGLKAYQEAKAAEKAAKQKALEEAAAQAAAQGIDLAAVGAAAAGVAGAQDVAEATSDLEDGVGLEDPELDETDAEDPDLDEEDDDNPEVQG